MLLVLLCLGQGGLGRVGRLAFGGGLGCGLLLLRLGNQLGIGLRRQRSLLGCLVCSRGSGDLVLGAGQSFVGRLLLRLGFGQLLRRLVGLVLQFLFALPSSVQGGLGSVGHSAFGGRLGRGALGFDVEFVGRVGGGLRHGLSLLRRLLGSIVSLLQWGGDGLGIGQRLVQGWLGDRRVGQGLDGSGQVGLGLLQLSDARLARQILRIGGLLSLRVGHFPRVGISHVGLLHGGP